MPVTESTLSLEPICTSGGVCHHRRFSVKRAYAHSFLGMIAVRFLGLITGILAAHLLGPTGRGQLAVIVLLPTALLPVGEFELPRSIAYQISRSDYASPRFVATTFWLAVVLGTLQAVLLSAVASFFLPPDKSYLLASARWFAFCLPFNYVITFLTGIDQGSGRFGRFSFFQVLPTAIYLLSILLAYVTGRISPPIFAFGILAGAIVAAVARGGIEIRSIFTASFERVTATKLLTRGLTFYVPAMVGLTLFRADMFVLLRFVPVQAIGLYAVAQAIALGQIGTAIPFFQVGFTLVAKEKSLSGAIQELKAQFRVAQVVLFMVGVATAALTPYIIHLAFGRQFSAAIPVTCILIAASSVWGLGQVLEQSLRAAGYPNVGILSNLVGVITLLALGIPAANRSGITGLGLSVLCAQVANCSILIIFCLIRLKISLSELLSFRFSPAQATQTFNRIFNRSSRR